MPDPKVDVYAAAKKATSIGPSGGRMSPAPEPHTTLEHQQEDPIAMFMQAMGDPLQNVGVPGGGPVEAVAAVAPEQIGKLREMGKILLDRMKAAKVMPRYSYGMPMTINDAIPASRQVAPVSDELMSVLEYVQKRWPRVFGHNIGFGDMDAAIKAKRFDSVIGGTSIPTWGGPTLGGGPSKLAKYSRIELDPQAIERMHPGEAGLADTVGHEFLHNADRIAVPQFDQKYAVQHNKVGYWNNPYEVRARKQGEKTAKAYAHYKATGEMRPPREYKKPAPQLENHITEAERLLKMIGLNPPKP